MQLRKTCNHPDLVTGPYSGDMLYPEWQELESQSGKLALLNRLLKRLLPNGHKVLIFSQVSAAQVATAPAPVGGEVLVGWKRADTVRLDREWESYDQGVCCELGLSTLLPVAARSDGLYPQKDVMACVCATLLAGAVLHGKCVHFAGRAVQHPTFAMRCFAAFVAPF